MSETAAGEPPRVKYGAIRLEILKGLLTTLKRGRLLDLGCGPGLTSILARDLGWKVTAVDVRTKRMPKARGIRWVHADVREYEIPPGRYACILVLGLLYHLELPDALDLLKRCATSPTIVDTHVSLAPDREVLGYRGSLFDELAGRTREEHAKSPTASWGNETAFWPDEESLIRMFSDCGFGRTLKLIPSYREDRTFYLCLPR